MEDPYQFAESLDQETLEYVKERNSEFSGIYGGVSKSTGNKIAGFLQVKIVKQAVLSGKNTAVLYRENQKYHVSLNDHDIYSTDRVISWISLSDDGTRIAIFETTGSDMGTLKIIRNGKVDQEISGNIVQVVFTATSFYMVKSYIEAPPPDGGELNSHRVLMNGGIVFGSGWDSTKFINIHRSGDQMIATVGDWNRSSIYCGELDNPMAWKKAYDLDAPAEPVGIVAGEVCYLKKDGNGVLMAGEKEIIRFPNPVESCSLVHDGFLVTYLLDAKLGAWLYGLSGKKLREFPLQDAMGLVSSDSDQESAVLVMSSFGIPYSLWKYENMKLGMMEENRLLDVRIEDRWVQSSGAEVHYFLVHPRNQEKKRALAYGYGGYNISLTPVYSPIFAALLSDGIAISQANLRGGGEYGKEWHDSGILGKKQNVFDDFISVISDMKQMGYSVVAKGESNGGLLVGAVLTQRPDILDGAVIGVPVLDMLRFHLMSVGKYWITEFGNPEEEGDAAFLSRYSPYHNLSRKAYPRTLIYSRWNDDRVHPAHAIKFHMRLREYSGGAFLRIGMSGGHSGITPLEETREISDIYSFITDCLNNS